MDPILPKNLFDSKEYALAKPEILIIYLTIKALEEYGFEVTISNIEEKISLHNFTIKRQMENLVKMGWIKEIGKGFYSTKDDGNSLLKLIINTTKKYDKKSVEKVEQKSVRQKFNEMQQRQQTEQKAALARQIKRKANMPEKPRKITAVNVLSEFIKRFENNYDKMYPISKRKSLAYCKRALEWVDHDFERLCSILDYLFEHWIKIKGVFKFNDNYPTITLLGTASLWNKICGLHDHGFRSDMNIKNRGQYDDKDKEQDEGW